jgi:hypothetical protein
MQTQFFREFLKQHQLNTIDRMKTRNNTTLIQLSLERRYFVVVEVRFDKTQFFCEFREQHLLNTIHIINAILQQVHQHHVVASQYARSHEVVSSNT